MAETPPAALFDRLSPFGQEHVLRWWPELNERQRRELAQQLDAVDLEALERLRTGSLETRETPADRARRARSLQTVVRTPDATTQPQWREATQRGRTLLAEGKVGALLVAGGQGTRLGFDRPKGVYRIGPVSGHSLFQILAEQVLARSRQAGARIPYFIMTSGATHAETVRFFEEHDFFGLAAEDVFFFQQGTMPAVDASSGRLLMANKHSLCSSPDGHGGVLAALREAGLLIEMQRRGIEYLHYHQVDNPTAIVCDPAFLGFHVMQDSELSTKVVAKRAPEEKMGVLAEIDGRTEIIEYSDLPDELARETEPDAESGGRLRFWAGNTAIHVFSRQFLERLVEDAESLPFHVAHKAVPHIDEQGQPVQPEKPNAYKFERFIFDALPKAQRALVVEADRAREFNPVKNREGNDSPQTAREAMCRLHADWLRAAGQPVPEGAVVEVGPLAALDEEELRAKLQGQSIYGGRLYLG